MPWPLPPPIFPTSGSFADPRQKATSKVSWKIKFLASQSRRGSWGMNLRVKRQKTGTSIKEKKRWDFVTSL